MLVVAHDIFLVGCAVVVTDRQKRETSRVNISDFLVTPYTPCDIIEEFFGFFLLSFPRKHVTTWHVCQQSKKTRACVCLRIVSTGYTLILIVLIFYLLEGNTGIRHTTSISEFSARWHAAAARVSFVPNAGS